MEARIEFEKTKGFLKQHELTLKEYDSLKEIKDIEFQEYVERQIRLEKASINLRKKDLIALEFLIPLYEKYEILSILGRLPELMCVGVEDLKKLEESILALEISNLTKISLLQWFIETKLSL